MATPAKIEWFNAVCDLETGTPQAATVARVQATFKESLIALESVLKRNERNLERAVTVRKQALLTLGKAGVIQEQMKGLSNSQALTARSEAKEIIAKSLADIEELKENTARTEEMNLDALGLLAMAREITEAVDRQDWAPAALRMRQCWVVLEKWGEWAITPPGTLGQTGSTYH